MPFSISNFFSSFSRGSSSGKELSDSNENPPGPSKPNIYDFNDDWENIMVKKKSESDLPRCSTPKFTYQKSKLGKKSNQKNERDQISYYNFNPSLTSKNNILCKPKMHNDKRGPQDHTLKGDVGKPRTSRNVSNQPTQIHQKDWCENMPVEVKSRKSLFPEALKSNNLLRQPKFTNYKREDAVLPQKSCLKDTFKYGQVHESQWGVNNQSLILPQNQIGFNFNHYESNQNESLIERRRSENQSLINASMTHRNLSTSPQRLSNRSYRNQKEKSGVRNGLQKSKYDFKTYRNNSHDDWSAEEVEVKNESPDINLEKKMHLPTTSRFSNGQKVPRLKKKLYTPSSESEYQPLDSTKAKLASIGLTIASPKKSSRRQTKKSVKLPIVSKSRKSKTEDDKSFVFRKRKLNKAEETLKEDHTDELASKRPKTSRRVSTRAKKTINYKEEKSDAESLKNQAIKKKETKDIYNEEEISDEEFKPKKTMKIVIKKQEMKDIYNEEEISDEELVPKKMMKKKETKVVNDKDEEKSNAESVLEKSIKKKETQEHTKITPNDDVTNLEHYEEEMKNDGDKIGDIALEENILNITPILISSDLGVEDGKLEDVFVSTEFKIVHTQDGKKVQDQEIIPLSSDEEVNIEELQKQKPQRELMDLEPERIADVQGNDYMEEIQCQEPQKGYIEELQCQEPQKGYIEELQCQEPPKGLIDLVLEGIPDDIQVQPKKDEVLERICNAVEGISAALQNQNQIFELMIKLFLEQNNRNH